MIGHCSVEQRIVTADVIEQFCALTGDNDPLHVDAEFAAATLYGQRIAPGSLVMAYMMAAAAATTGTLDVAVPSVGFDRVRHTAAVLIGDELRIEYRIVSLVDGRGHADIVVTNQRGETVAVADHVFRVLP